MPIPISPYETREGLIALIGRLDGLCSALKETVQQSHEQLAECTRECEDYNGKHQAAVMEIDRLRAVLEKIKGGRSEDPQLDAIRALGQALPASPKELD